MRIKSNINRSMDSFLQEVDCRNRESRYRLGSLEDIVGGDELEGEGESTDTGLLLHLDIASTVDSTIVKAIFSLAVLGILSESQYSTLPATYCFNPQTTVVCIELAPGLLGGCLSHCEVSKLQSDSFRGGARSIVYHTCILNMPLITFVQYFYRFLV